MQTQKGCDFAGASRVSSLTPLAVVALRNVGTYRRGGSVRFPHTFRACRLQAASLAWHACGLVNAHHAVGCRPAACWLAEVGVHAMHASRLARHALAGAQPCLWPPTRHPQHVETTGILGMNKLKTLGLTVTTPVNSPQYYVTSALGHSVSSTRQQICWC